MRPRLRHAWNLTPANAVALQRRLAARVRQEPLRRGVRLVAGCDCAFSSDGRRIIAAWVVWDMAASQVVETEHAVRRVSFPYVPGLLSFRECPALIAAAARLRATPDVLMMDGQGIAHPRRFGLACHIGVLFDLPAIGCAKSLLCGEYDEPAKRAGSRRAIRYEGGRIGFALRTRDKVKPIFVSVGHRCAEVDAARIVLACGGGYRLPEPTRRADRLVGELRRSMPQAGFA